MTEQKKGMTRRSFLFGAASVSVVACGGLGYWGMHGPSISFIQTSYQGQTANSPKILLAYASQYGSTGGVADAIAQALHFQGATVDVGLVEDARDVARYDAVVVGAPIISEEWMPEARNFVNRQRAILSTMPVAYFLTCMTLALSTDEAERAGVVEYLEAVENDIDAVKPIELGLFAGAIDYGKMSPVMNVLYRVFSEDDTSGDFRDYDAIRVWADALYPRLISG